MDEDRERRTRRVALRVLNAAVIVFVLAALGGLVYSWWTVFGPMPRTVDTVRSMTELPVPGSATIVGMRTERFLRPWLKARLRMPTDDFERWREELPFDLTRDPETVEVALYRLRWTGGEDARPPDWWRPEDLQDPLAAFASYPTSGQPPDDPFPAHNLRMLAEERPDGTVDVYLTNLVD